MDPRVSAALIKVGGSLLGGLFGPKPEKRIDPRQATLLSAQGAMEAQEQYGINALELIRGGAGMGTMEAQPRVGTQAMFGQVFDEIADLVSGKDAQDEKLRQLEIERAEILLDEAKRGQIKSERPDETGNRDYMGAVPKAGREHTGGEEQAPPFKPVSGAHEVSLPSGSTVEVPVGPDADEVLTGTGIRVYGNTRDYILELDKRMKENYAEGKPIWANREPRLKPQTTVQLPQGMTAPEGWDFWNDERRKAWITRWQ